MRPALSVQLYSLRDQLAADPAATIQAVAAIGFTAVEPFGLAEAATVLRPLLVDAGIVAPTAHGTLVASDEAADATLAAAVMLGTDTVFDPFIPEERWTTRDDIAATAARLNDVARRAADRGLSVGYHNHWWELERRVDGTSALELFAELLDEGVLLEVDAYWAAVGGEDPVALVRRLGDRVVALHIKDGPLTRETKDQQPAGHGAMPIAELLEAAPGARLVLEFDDYTGDLIEGLTLAKATVDRLEGAR
jgi:sugar phosphate isomerase/epimerase